MGRGPGWTATLRPFPACVALDEVLKFSRRCFFNRRKDDFDNSKLQCQCKKRYHHAGYAIQVTAGVSTRSLHPGAGPRLMSTPLLSSRPCWTEAQRKKEPPSCDQQQTLYRWRVEEVHFPPLCGLTTPPRTTFSQKSNRCHVLSCSVLSLGHRGVLGRVGTAQETEPPSLSRVTVLCYITKRGWTVPVAWRRHGLGHITGVHHSCVCADAGQTSWLCLGSYENVAHGTVGSLSRRKW